MKTTLKRFISAVLGVSAGALLFSAAACAQSDGNGDAVLKETKLWLDRYEECALPVKDGVDLSTLTVTSDHEDLVRYENGTVIATGKAEKTTDVTLTVKQGKTSSILSVKVRDSGAVPELQMPDPSVYVGVAIDLPVSVIYLDKEMPVDLSKYEVEELGDGLVSYENGKIEGLSLGETELSVTLDYKGYECLEMFEVKVKPANILEFNVETLEIYQADSKLAKAQLVPKVVKEGHVIENAAVTYEITEGAGNISVSESGAVQAVKSGTAKIKATYTQDSSVYGELPVIVHENHVKESFTPSPVGGLDPADGKEKYTSLTKEDGEIGGVTSSDMWKLTFGYIENEDNNKTDMWSHRALVGEYGTNFVEAYRKGYRYFVYDLYYEDGEVITVGDKQYHKPFTQVYVGSGGDASHQGALCEFIQFDQYFHRGYMRVLQKNGDEWEETGVLRKNQWVRIVYDMKYYAFNYPNAVVGFFFTSGQTGSKAYFDNVRYYLDGTFLPEETRTYEEKDGFVQATNEELHLYGVDSGTKYEKAGEIDGVTDDGVHTNAYKYATPNKADSWKNQLIVVPSDDSSIGVGMLSLTEHGNYLTFDFYAENAANLSITLGHWLYSKTIRLTVGNKAGSSLETDKYIAVLKDGKRLYTLPQGEWVTVSLAFRDAYQPVSGWSRASIFVGLTGANETAYIDNIRYYETNAYIPTEFDGERPVSDFFISGSDYETLSFAKKEADGEAFEGTVKYTSVLTGAILETEKRWSDGLQFSNIHDSSFHPAGDFYDKGYHYITFKMYVTGNFGAINVQAFCNDGKGAAQYYISILQNKKTSRNVYLMNEAGTEYVRYLEKDTWYTLTIPVEYAAKPTNWSSVYYRLLKGDGDGAAVAYVKDLKYHNTAPAEVPADPTDIYRPYIADTSEQSLTFIEEEGAYKNSFKLTHTANGNLKFATRQGAPTDTTILDENAEYVTMETYFENVMDLNFVSRLSSYTNGWCYAFDWLAFGKTNTTDGVIFYDMETGDVVTTPQNGTWYKTAFKIKRTSSGWEGPDLYLDISKASGAESFSMYFKNVAYGKNIYAK